MSHMDYAKALMAERDEIDTKIDENRLVLETNNSTMDSPLIDAEGFPIATIDVYSVRHARHNIICLQNDRKALDEKIETIIQKVHEESKTEPGSAMEIEHEKPVHRTSNNPFAKVTTVTSGSPADLAGLKTDDLIVQYGPLHFDSFTGLPQFAETSSKNEGKVLRVTVIRNNRPVRLEIQPRRWNGNGLLGCAVVSEKPDSV